MKLIWYANTAKGFSWVSSFTCSETLKYCNFQNGNQWAVHSERPVISFDFLLLLINETQVFLIRLLD